MSALEPTYDRHRLVAAALDAGCDFNDRLLTDWVSKGLLHQPDRPGRGVGKGREQARWTTNQKDLLLALLAKRPTVKRLATLANIPVALWLYVGDDYVPLPQARRALRYWAASHRSARSWKAARVQATELVTELAHTEAHRIDTRAAIDTIVAAIGSGTIDEEELAAVLRPVLDPIHVEGPELARVEPAALARFISRRVYASNHLDAYTDADYITARSNHLAALTDYLGTVPALDERNATRACTDLLTQLGHLPDR